MSCLGLGAFKSRSRFDSLLKVSVSHRQYLVSVSKILAETPALLKIVEDFLSVQNFQIQQENNISRTSHQCYSSVYKSTAKKILAGKIFIQCIYLIELKYCNLRILGFLEAKCGILNCMK